ncbi:MAG TPA: peptidoglycan endopeptidase [Sphingomicrobium sp.]
MRHDYAERAEALVGTRFRPQGRDSETGVDCVGLVLLAYEIAPDMVRRNYRLRGDHRAEIERALARFFNRTRARDTRRADLMLLAVAADQFHFGISTGRGFVHADARLGRVVETPGTPRWPVLATFRRRTGRCA